jgi:hypothetical protein
MRVAEHEGSGPTVSPSSLVPCFDERGADPAALMFRPNRKWSQRKGPERRLDR